MFRQGGQRDFSPARERRSTADRRLAAWGGSATAAEKPLPRKGPEVGSRGITVNNIEPGPIDTDLNPAAGDWAVPFRHVIASDYTAFVYAFEESVEIGAE